MNYHERKESWGVSGGWMLGPKQDFYTTHSKAQGTLQRRRQKERQSQKVGRRAWTCYPLGMTATASIPSQQLQWQPAQDWVCCGAERSPPARPLALLLTRPDLTLLHYRLLRNLGPRILPETSLFGLAYGPPFSLIVYPWMSECKAPVNIHNPRSHSQPLGHKIKQKIWMWEETWRDGQRWKG